MPLPTPVMKTMVGVAVMVGDVVVVLRIELQCQSRSEMQILIYNTLAKLHHQSRGFWVQGGGANIFLATLPFVAEALDF
jgi:hypothetical protein